MPKAALPVKIPLFNTKSSFTSQSTASYSQEINACSKEIVTCNEEMTAYSEEMTVCSHEINTDSMEIQSYIEEIIACSEEVTAYNEEMSLYNGEIAYYKTEIYSCTWKIGTPNRILGRDFANQRITGKLDIQNQPCMKNICCLILLSIPILSAGQDSTIVFEIPKNWESTMEANYAAHEKDIIACADWLENSPIDKNEKKRKEANAFLMKWLTGTKSISINLNADILMPYCKKNEHFLFIFLAGWARYALKNNYDSDELTGYMEGFKSILHTYSQGGGVKKDKEMDKLTEINKNAGLKDFVVEKLKKIYLKN